MAGKDNSFLIGINVKSLHEILQQYVETMEHCQKYARLFLKLAQSEERAISDVWGSFDQMQALAQKAFSEEFDDDEEEIRTSVRRLSLNSAGSIRSSLHSFQG